MQPDFAIVLRESLTSTHADLASDIDTFDALYNIPETTDHALRVEFAGLSANTKQLLALLRFAPISFTGANREAVAVDLLAYLELKPVRRPEWYQFFEELKKLLYLTMRDTEDLFLVEGRDVTGPFHTMYVSGVDRVSEGDEELDFDIPEASMQDQVREEIDFLVEILQRKMQDKAS